ncbi:MAG: DoxX family protein [Phycisphaerales bacterium]|nr:DoxX family protein [Phycisphaerales bacterium]
MNSMMPFLARLVIASAILTSGWVHCFVQVKISPEQATAIEAMDLSVLRDTESGGQTTRGLHRIALLLNQEWPQLGGWGTLLAWAAGVFELITGALLVVGLFARLSAFVVCFIMGMALYLVSYKLNGMFTMNPFEWPLQHVAFSQLCTEMSLFVLALWIVIGGPGLFSIDHYHASNTKVPHNSSDKPVKKGNE